MLTTLTMIAIAYASFRYGKRKGEQEMYQLCYDAEQAKREFFSRISLN